MELCKLDTYELACLCMPHLDGPILPPFKATAFANYEASLFITIVYTNCSWFLIWIFFLEFIRKACLWNFISCLWVSVVDNGVQLLINCFWQCVSGSLQKTGINIGTGIYVRLFICSLYTLKYLLVCCL